MLVNENVTLTANVIVKDANNVDTVVMILFATLDRNKMNYNINSNTYNNELALANSESVKQQYDEFMTQVKARATELGYVIL